jgi:hypothetical protein
MPEPLRPNRQALLSEVEARLAAAPDDLDARFDRAALLWGLGRTDAARDAYLDLLALAPTHFGALNNLGVLLAATGYQSAARTAWAEAVKHHPDKADGRVNLGGALARAGEVEAAREEFLGALALDPDHADAHQGLALLLAEAGDEAAARPHRLQGFKDRPVMELPYRGTGTPVRLLVLASAVGGTVPIRHHLDDRRVQASVVFVEAFDPATPPPPHDRVLNTIGDADIASDALETAEALLRRTDAPVINPPARVAVTGRAANAARLGALPGVITPHMATLPRDVLEAGNAAAELARLGFGFPLLLRAPGFHAGRFFVKVDGPGDLPAAVAGLPGETLIVIAFHDARSADGKIRKYRVMMVGGVLYPLHAAVSGEWKIHYFSADMADHPAHRAEDEAFLDDMAGVLGPKAMAALEAVRDVLGLDYAGADFSLTPEGDLLLFEANATMVVNPPDPDARWDYREPHVRRVIEAIEALLIGPVEGG